MALSGFTSSAAPKKPMSPARLRAQLANARLSTGPRTRAGRRRSALNRLGLRRSELEGLGSSTAERYRESLRVWRDLVVAFRFIRPEVWRETPALEFHLRQAAEAWVSKLHSERDGFINKQMNAEIHLHLSRFMYGYRSGNRKADCRLRREFGADGRTDIDQLRAAIEARLSSFRGRSKLLLRAAGGPPGWSPSDRTQFQKWRYAIDNI